VKIVVTGKGGVGKTTVAGALARHLARRGNDVVAVDCDPSPNLGITLAMTPEAVEALEPVLNGLIASGYTHHDPKPAAEDLLRRFGVEAGDGVRLVATARIERIPKSCMCCGSHNSTRELFSDLSGDGRVVIADLEAGINDLLWAHPKPEDVVVAVADTSAKAVEIARRACRIAEQMGVGRVIAVANRCSGPNDAARVEAAIGIPVFAVPEDRVVSRADHAGIGPLDMADESPAMDAVGRLAELLVPVVLV
jgi:CO dehydrogenase maturation factor